MLNVVGVTVLVLGLSIASIVLVTGAGRSKTQGATGAASDWQDGSLSIVDSKASSRDMEMYNGKLGMLALRLSDAQTARIAGHDYRHDQQPVCAGLFLCLAPLVLRASSRGRRSSPVTATNCKTHTLHVTNTAS